MSGTLVIADAFFAGHSARYRHKLIFFEMGLFQTPNELGYQNEIFRCKSVTLHLGFKWRTLFFWSLWLYFGGKGFLGEGIISGHVIFSGRKITISSCLVAVVLLEAVIQRCVIASVE